MPKTRYAIYRGRDLLGTTRLEYALVPGHWAGGEFFPTRHYYLVERIFLRLKFALAREPDTAPAIVRERDNLGLELWRSGERLDGTIELVTQWGARRWMVHVKTNDARVWGDRGH